MRNGGRIRTTTDTTAISGDDFLLNKKKNNSVWQKENYTTELEKCLRCWE